MDFDITIFEDCGLDIVQGTYFTGRRDKYVSAVLRYYRNYEKNKAKVEEALAAGDYENYTISVHALKSNSKMIGAMELSKAFEELENAGRENQTDVIEQKHPQVMEAYAALIDKLSPVESAGDAKPSDEIDGETARRVADDLIEELDNFEDEKSMELANTLRGYPFRITQMEKLKEAIAKIEDFMYDEAAEIIKEIYTAIE